MQKAHSFHVGQRVQVGPARRGDLSYVYAGLHGTITRVLTAVFPHDEGGYEVVFDLRGNVLPLRGILPEHCLEAEPQRP